MRIEYLERFIGKKLKIVLTNGFIYHGKIVNIDGIYLVLSDNTFIVSDSIVAVEEEKA